MLLTLLTSLILIPIIVHSDESRECNADYRTYAISATEAYNYLNSHSEKITIIDLREPARYKTGHIKDAININFLHNDFNYLIYKLDRTGIYFLYSDSDDEAYTTALMMIEMNFISPYFLQDGLRSWRKQGYPLVK